MNRYVMIALFNLAACVPVTDKAGTAPVDSGVATDDTGAPDADGDGSPAGEDCDDGNASIYPGADEYCNGVDDNCDGEVDGPDEAVDVYIWYVDADADGYGTPFHEPAHGCDPDLDGYVLNANDCDDTNAAINPEAEEDCNDEVDTDCDSLIDFDDDFCVALCGVETELADGSTVLLPNEITVSLSSSSPSGDIGAGEDVERLELLRVNYEVEREDCPSLYLIDPRLKGTWTDNWDTGWYPKDVFGTVLTTDEGLGVAEMDGRYYDFDVAFEMVGGTRYSVAYYGNVSGASEEWGDEVRMDIPEGSVKVSIASSGASVYTLDSDVIYGSSRTL